MANIFRDVDAPNRNWSGTEAPLPLLFGRIPYLGGAYRFLSGRPLDGVARTDASFLRPGTKSFSKDGHSRFWDYWPGWKRGLLLTRVPSTVLPAYAVTAAGWEYFATQPWWMNWEIPVMGEAVVAGWWLHQGIQAGANWSFERRYLRPLRNSVVNVLRTRDKVRLDIPRALVSASTPGPTGRIYLPERFVADGDRDNFVEMVRAKLGNSALDGRWNQEGNRPHLELYVPAQPPQRVSWEQGLEHADVAAPNLGISSAGAVGWDLGQESPHLAVPGPSGVGKSDLIAWVVAQFMRGGCALAVLDPKASSHRWLHNIPGVEYPWEAQGMHDLILWLDEELRRRKSEDRKEEQEFPRLVVVLEERNSLQSMLRELWAEIREPGMPTRSPALAALDRLLSMGRSLSFTIIQASQETAQQAIGSRANYGSFAVAGRMAENHWRNVGTKKPSISGKPGRWGYVVNGEVTTFQAPFVDLKHHADRVREWALGGEPLVNVRELMTQTASESIAWSAPMSSGQPTEVHATLPEFAASSGISLAALNNARQRHSDFPAPVGNRGKAMLYRLADLEQHFQLTA